MCVLDTVHGQLRIASPEQEVIERFSVHIGNIIFVLCTDRYCLHFVAISIILENFMKTQKTATTCKIYVQ